jgi:hypothetical protein
VAPVDLTDLQHAIGQYTDQHSLLMSAGPFTAAAAVRTVTKNKLATVAVVTSGAWLAIHNLSAPMMKLIQDQFGNLDSLLSMFHG